MKTRRIQKGHSDRPKFRSWHHPFSSASKIEKKPVEYLRKQNGQERTRVVCSRDVKQMNIGSLANESG